MAIIKKSTNNTCLRDCGEKGTLPHCWWECKLVQPLWKTKWRVLKKLKTEVPYDPAILLLGVCVCVCVSHSVVSDLMWPYGLQPSRLLCPWGFPGKNAEMGCHFLLQGISWHISGQNCNPKRYMHLYVHSSMVHKSQDMEGI